MTHAAWRVECEDVEGGAMTRKITDEEVAAIRRERQRDGTAWTVDDAMRAEIARLQDERDAAFTRGVEVMREAAAKACENHWLGGDREPARETSRVLAVVATDIRALKVAP